MDSWLFSMMRSCMVLRVSMYVEVYVMMRSIEMDLGIVVPLVVCVGCFPWSWYVRIHVLVLGSINVAVVVLGLNSVLTVVVWIYHLVMGYVVIIVMDWCSMASLVPVSEIVVIGRVQGLVKIVNWSLNRVLRIPWDWLC